jgi:hypothetical protein
MSLVHPVSDDFEHQADALITSFRRAAQAQGPQACLYVLIDPVLSDPLSQLNETKTLPVCRLSIRHEGLAKDDTPYLLIVGLEQDHERLVSHTLRLALAEHKNAMLNTPAACSVCAWLFVDGGDALQLSAALASLALIAQPGSQSATNLFRFWDPRVFRHLPRIVGKESLEVLLPAKLRVRWFSLAAGGQLITQSFSNGEGWQPSEAEWSSLARIEDVNQCLLLSETQELVGSSSHVGRLERALQRALELGCSESLDRVTYALLVMSLGSYFESHPLMVQIFRQVAREQVSFAALAEEVQQDVWDRIKTDMARDGAHQK